MSSPLDNASLEHRRAKRAGILNAVRATDGYHAYEASLKNNDPRALAVPSPPDPNDPRINKRHWDKLVSVWKRRLRHWCAPSSGNDEVEDHDDLEKRATPDDEVNDDGEKNDADSKNEKEDDDDKIVTQGGSGGVRA